MKCVANAFQQVAGIHTLTLMLALFVATFSEPTAPNPEKLGDVFPIMGWIGSPKEVQTMFLSSLDFSRIATAMSM